MLIKTLFLLLVSFALGSCTENSNTLTIQPNIELPQQDPSMSGVIISVNGADQRRDHSLAKINRDGKLVVLTPSRDLRFLLQEALEKQMTARGYMISPDGAVNLQIVLNNLYADVAQGNVRYNITTKADISVIATAKNGNQQVKNYCQVYSVEGAFSATNEKITNAVNSTLSDVIASMGQDSSILSFIRKNAH
ncbi:lipoprotein [Pantoea sp. Nvir]|uniref:lipoprotein n=1 Tax=Pantoea sp. Nvir TaxID=2576760 RepID=UPI00135CC1A1|nr:lipoprotein [Pantoea sp. Nvir]MXP66379.1 hypothetical protein [Pantoea sp. Nvir]CAJ0993118.1 hypothetical protein NVIRPANT_00892 [Pantoea sp. Nvir]